MRGADIDGECSMGSLVSIGVSRPGFVSYALAAELVFPLKIAVL